jgi:uncharacterized peroxidase-related enzyme
MQAIRRMIAPIIDDKYPMSRLTKHTADTAPQASKPFVNQSLAANGFLPNLIATLANSPAAIETYFAVGTINGRSGLSFAEREAVQITAAAVHGCGFCVAGHTAVARNKVKLDASVVDALRAQRTVPDARLEAVANFARAVIVRRGAVADNDYEAFRAAGFSEEQALDVVLGVSLATLCNFANNLARNELNPELAPHAWQPASST